VPAPPPARHGRGVRRGRDHRRRDVVRGAGRARRRARRRARARRGGPLRGRGDVAEAAARTRRRADDDMGRVPRGDRRARALRPAPRGPGRIRPRVLDVGRRAARPRPHGRRVHHVGIRAHPPQRRPGRRDDVPRAADRRPAVLARAQRGPRPGRVRGRRAVPRRGRRRDPAAPTRAPCRARRALSRLITQSWWWLPPQPCPGLPTPRLRAAAGTSSHAGPAPPGRGARLRDPRAGPKPARPGGTDPSRRQTSRPARSTLRWKRMPAMPPRTAPTRLTTAAATRATTPPVVRSPALTGICGNALSCDSTLNWLPATRPRRASTIAMTTAHSHTARPCFAPSNRAMRPATYPPQK